MDLSPHIRQRLSRNGDWTEIHVVQLACSRDLKKWERLGNRAPFIAPSRLDSGAYDTQTVSAPGQPAIHGDKLWCQGRSNLRTRGGAKVYQPGVDVQRKCHPGGEVSRSR